MLVEKFNIETAKVSVAISYNIQPITSASIDSLYKCLRQKIVRQRKKNEGVLIYATCSYSAKENEDILDFVADNYFVANSKRSSGWSFSQSITQNNCREKVLLHFNFQLTSCLLYLQEVKRNHLYLFQQVLYEYTILH